MKLLLFGGTFNPPHLGHMQLLQNAIATVQPSKVVVMPDAQPPHKPSGNTPALLRLAMCQCFKPLFDGLEISRLELERGGKSYTIDTVQSLIRQHASMHVHLCIGGDMMLSFASWHRYQKLLRLVTLVVHARTNEEMPALLQAASALTSEGGTILFSKGSVLPLSSSEIRVKVRQGEDISEMVSPLVQKIITQNKLYL